MALNSMTGFARAEGQSGQASWFWEIRSVNGRGLDVRTRFPAGYETLESAVRTKASKQFKRGNVSATLTLRHDANVSELRLNESALDRVLSAAEAVRKMPGVSSEAELSPDIVLGLRGVLETVEPELSEVDLKKLHDAILASYEEVLAGLAKARGQEGAQLEKVVLAQISEIERLITKIETAPVRTPDAIKARLHEQVEKLLETGQNFDAGRLHQEAVLIATRVDIEEELKRLKAHITAAKELLTVDDAVGRKLDFLAQEFNREANTICSKSYDATVTQSGLELKVVIDQMREQVQNIE